MTLATGSNTAAANDWMGAKTSRAVPLTRVIAPPASLR